MNGLTRLSVLSGQASRRVLNWISAGCAAFFLVCSMAAMAQEPELSAKWIWAPRVDSLTPAYREYNEMVCLAKQINLTKFDTAILRITADSWYRLKINDVWVADGPCRSWPEHYQYDVLDVAPYLTANASNIITITAKYFGVGTFHVIPQQAGVLAQLDLDGTTVLKTDGTWIAMDMPQWVSNTPKMYIQMEGNEWYDARLEGTGKTAHAVELFDATEGPWQDLNPRDVALLSRTPMYFQRFVDAHIVRADGLDYCIQPTHLNYPGFIEANHTTSMAGGMVTLLENSEPCEIELREMDMSVAVDGKEGSGKMKLAPGSHLISAYTRGINGHLREKSLRFSGNTNGFKLVNLLDNRFENPWSYVHFPECYYSTNDYVKPQPEVARKNALYDQKRGELLKAANRDELFAIGKDRLKNYPSSQMLFKDNYWCFTDRQVVTAATGEQIKNPTGLIHNNAAVTTVYPDARGDIELLYDLGVQSCGYYSFRMDAPAGTILDVNQLEYIDKEGRVQGTELYRNTMRYIAKGGHNEMTSIKRRSGRYIFLTFRNMTGPVEIQNFHLIESTYPVDYQGAFACSDARLSKIWDISTRTLKLCMEDTYTDCPLYEQTHWVGDARNESLFAFGVFGAEDLAKRCINITARSLEHYPFAGCQTPSCWDTLLPAWSFMWGISLWDYYWQTGDKEFIETYLPYAIQNLKGTANYMKDGLFSGPFWNMFDWSGADQGPDTVIHNSMFMVGAIDAALKLSAEIGGCPEDEWLKSTRATLVDSINKLWNNEKQSYPDSIHNDGEISSSTCQHTSFLALLFNIIEPQNSEAAINNLINPPQGMVKLGSPFAALYMYETLEKVGLQNEIMEQIYKNYLPMLEIGSTTVWESFPGGTSSSAFPTRSHCHAWSSAPSRFLPRIVLGIVPTAPAATEVELSPRVYDLTWAEGRVATTKGTMSARWWIDGKVLNIAYTAPEGVKVQFKRNSSMDEFVEIKLNGETVK